MSESDRQRVRGYFDRFAEAEWTRLTDTPNGRVSLEVHKQVLAEFVRPGDQVLEVGAGPGRFTIELAQLGAHTLVTDISPVQLDLNIEKVGATAAEASVVGRELLDITDTSRFADDSFDVVVAFGGPLSYVFEHADDAFAGLLRITRPGGYVLSSVMSTLGAWRHFLLGVVEVSTALGEDANDIVINTGDLRHLPSDHVCRMFRAGEFAELVTSAGADVVLMSASNWASLGDPTALEILADDPDRWANFVRHEINACREPGVLDGGTHIICVARKPL